MTRQGCGARGPRRTDAPVFQMHRSVVPLGPEETQTSGGWSDSRWTRSRRTPHTGVRGAWRNTGDGRKMRCSGSGKRLGAVLTCVFVQAVKRSAADRERAGHGRRHPTRPCGVWTRSPRERASLTFPMRPGQEERTGHDSVRHGTTTLIAAPGAKVGTVIAQCSGRHRAPQFRNFPDVVGTRRGSRHSRR